jgi:hypothetical protein
MAGRIGVTAASWSRQRRSSPNRKAVQLRFREPSPRQQTGTILRPMPPSGSLSMVDFKKQVKTPCSCWTFGSTVSR